MLSFKLTVTDTQVRMPATKGKLMRWVLEQKERGLFRCHDLGDWWTSVSKTTLPSCWSLRFLRKGELFFLSNFLASLWSVLGPYPFIFLTFSLLSVRTSPCAILGKGPVLSVCGVKVSGGRGAAGPTIRKPGDAVALSPPMELHMVPAHQVESVGHPWIPMYPHTLYSPLCSPPLWSGQPSPYSPCQRPPMLWLTDCLQECYHPGFFHFYQLIQLLVGESQAQHWMTKARENNPMDNFNCIRPISL